MSEASTVNLRLVRAAMFIIAVPLVVSPLIGLLFDLWQASFARGGKDRQEIVRLGFMLMWHGRDLVVVIGAMLAAAGVGWTSRPGVLWLAGGVIELGSTLYSLVGTFSAPTHVSDGPAYGQITLFALAGLASVVCFGLAAVRTVRAAGKPCSLAWPIVVLVFELLAQGLHAVWISELFRNRSVLDSASAVNATLVYQLAQGAARSAPAVMLLMVRGALSLPTDRAPATSGLRGLRAVAGTRVGVGLTLGLVIRLALATKSFDAAWWMLLLATVLSFAIAIWLVVALAEISSEAGGLAAVAALLALFALPFDVHAAQTTMKLLDSLGRDPFEISPWAPKIEPSVAILIVAGALGILSSCFVFASLAKIASRRRVEGLAARALVGALLCLLAGVGATVLQAGLTAREPWFGASVIFPLGVAIFVLAIAALARFFTVTRELLSAETLAQEDASGYH